MFISADTMALLLESGLPSEKLVEIVRSLERDAQAVVGSRSTSAERQARYRQRQNDRRNGDVTRDVTERHETPSLPSSPQTPQQPTHPRGDIYTRGREADGFDTFWAAYPDKTGKKAARKAWDAAKDKPDLPALLLAIDQYRLTKPPDRAWCHASTWLNQGRWADEPPAPTGIHHDRPDRHQAARSDARSVWADIIADRNGEGTGPPEPLRLAG